MACGVSSQTRDRIYVSCIGRCVLYHWATREAWKAILWSENGEVRAQALEHKLSHSPNRLWEGCIKGLCRQRRGWGVSQWGGGAGQGAAVLLRLRLQCQECLCTWPATTILSCVFCSALLHRVLELKCPCSGFMLGTLIWHCKASARGTLWASGTTPSTKERRKIVRLYHPDSSFISWELLWAMPVTPGFPGSSDSKESACNVGDPGLIPGSGRSPG